MTNICSTGLPGGLNFDCLAYNSPVAGLIIMDTSVSFTAAELPVLANWKTEIQTNLDMWVPAGVEGYENTTDDPTINTTQSGGKTILRAGVPSGVFYLKSNYCDWNEVMRALKGGTYRVAFILENGMIVGFKDRNSTAHKGFLAEVKAITKGFPMPDTIENAFPVYINFKRYKEFEQQFGQIMDWEPILELPAAMPESYNLSEVSNTQATATVNVNVFERCGDAITGLGTADINTIANDLTDDTLVSVTDNGDGNYDVAYTTAAAGQYVKFQIKALTSTVVDAISNPLYVEFD